jgi:hypothetical protein
MRAVFHNPEALRPGRTSAAVTQGVAAHIGEIAAAMRERGLDPAAVAHFLDRIVFCLFAEDSRLLPDIVFRPPFPPPLQPRSHTQELPTVPNHPVLRGGEWQRARENRGKEGSGTPACENSFFGSFFFAALLA